jgi:hypothetical protein
LSAGRYPRIGRSPDWNPVLFREGFYGDQTYREQKPVEALSLPVAVSAMLYGLHAFYGRNTHAAVLRTYHVFDSIVCEKTDKHRRQSARPTGCRLLED